MTKQISVLLLVSLVLLKIPVQAASEGMSNMPTIQPKKVYRIKSAEEGEQLQEQRGYGDQEPMVRMMNLMMVGGSGYEGMDMEQMNAKGGHEGHAEHSGHSMGAMSAPMPAEGQTAQYDLLGEIVPKPPKVGANVFELRASIKNTQKPAKGLKFKAQVYMTSMDMGTEEPKVLEVSPGRYQTKAVFSMKGPWAVKILFPEGGEKVFTFEAK